MSAVAGDRSFDAIVVGAGHNGLVAAGYLAKAGLRVLVLERRDRPGGAADTAEIAPGVRAPVAAHTIGRLRRSLVRDLGLARHGLRVVEPDEIRAFCPQPDGRALTLWADPGRTADGLREWSLRDAGGYPVFEQRFRALASFMAHLHAVTPPDLSSPSPADALTGVRLLRAARGLGHPRHAREAVRVLPMSVADFLSEAFESDPLRAAIAARGVQFAAMAPRSAGTAAVLLGDSAGGGLAGQTAFARRGPGALADALVRAARAFGAEVRCAAEVAAIANAGERVTGVVLASGEEFRAPVIVSGLDPKRTLLSLVDPVAAGPTLRWRAGNLRLPGVVAKVNLALDGLPVFPAAVGRDEELLRGRIVIAPGLDHLERAFDASKYGRVSEEPFLEATIPTLSDPALAPEGVHVMSVLVQYAPYHRRDGSWEDPAERARLGDLVLGTLERYAPGLSGRVTARHVLTPLDLERDYGLTEGHPLHGEPGLDQFFAWRPLYGNARYRLECLRGLYLCGSGAHPGGGITGAPGANAAREILSDRKRLTRGGGRG